MDLPNNKHFVLETLERFLAQIGYFYVAKKSNKILIEKYLYYFPFFFMDQHYQNLLYKIIQKYKISNYYDKNEHMKFLCFKIYSDFCKSIDIQPKSIDEFYNNFKYELHSSTHEYNMIKRINMHTYIFYIVIFAILIVFAYFHNKTRQDNIFGN
jgi:hypothetical protein